MARTIKNNRIKRRGRFSKSVKAKGITKDLDKSFKKNYTSCPKIFSEKARKLGIKVDSEIGELLKNNTFFDPNVDILPQTKVVT